MQGDSVNQQEVLPTKARHRVNKGDKRDSL